VHERLFVVRTKRSTVPHRIVVSDDRRFLTPGQIRERYAVSAMWITRRLASDPHFPKPLCLGPRIRRWRRADLLAWQKTWAAWSEVRHHKMISRNAVSEDGIAGDHARTNGPKEGP
jgi:predicted DNA-binding transcriptional regulator AlpA